MSEWLTSGPAKPVPSGARVRISSQSFFLFFRFSFCNRQRLFHLHVNDASHPRERQFVRTIWRMVMVSWLKSYIDTSHRHRMTGLDREQGLGTACTRLCVFTFSFLPLLAEVCALIGTAARASIKLHAFS